MDNKELCKLRIEDYGRERESLRSMEWKILFETLAGYATLAIAFDKLHAYSPKSHVILALGWIAAIGLFAFGWSILRGIHLRSKSCADLKRAYFQRLHVLVNLHTESEPTKSELNRKWAIRPQFYLLVLVTIGFIAWMSWWTYEGK